jgi:hypothetical protein
MKPLIVACDDSFSKAHPPNLCLTATELHFIHPTTGKPVAIGMRYGAYSDVPALVYFLNNSI